jgi:DNA polymerase
MDESTRLNYLQLMGVESWVTKDAVMIPEATVLFEPPLETDSWAQLKTTVSECQQCNLHKTRTKTVFGEGDLNADWLLIGEAPGEQEDLQGKPFVGRAGFLLTEMLRAIQLNRERIFIANILKCRPPNNKDPRVGEINACQTYLQQQLALVKPKIILAMGRIAAQTLLNTSEPLHQLRGKVHYLETTPLIVVYHPAYLLRSLTQKRAAWQDLQLALNTYQQLPSK